MNKLLMEKDGDLMLLLKEKNYHNGFLILQNFQMNYLNDLKKFKGWPEKVKLMQKNWIGKSFGCEINFQIDKNEKKIKIFLQLDLIQFLVQVL